ncbi:hypothetical protein ACIHCV_43725 [Streptomyces sp. NPDC051956]|uniref:hypothetical protein n=1 Tax=Streptomyces sp. NPDC051956 TaxID=3365677 RepID=UPI0037CEA8F2
MDAGSMTALRSGVIQFGLVVLPVKLFSATEEHPAGCARSMPRTAQGAAPPAL